MRQRSPEIPPPSSEEEKKIDKMLEEIDRYTTPEALERSIKKLEEKIAHFKKIGVEPGFIKIMEEDLELKKAELKREPPEILKDIDELAKTARKKRKK